MPRLIFELLTTSTDKNFNEVCLKELPLQQKLILKEIAIITTVPVQNTDKYLNRCVNGDWVFCQTRNCVLWSL